MSAADHSQPPAPAAAQGANDDTNGFGLVVPFAKFLGIHVIEQTREKAVLRVHLNPELLNSGAWPTAAWS